MILLLGGEKGGTGKTTLSINLSVMRQQKTGEVLLVDADPQANASFWCAVRDQYNVSPRIPSVQKTGKNIREELIGLKNKYKDIVIDTGGRDSLELRASLLVADIALIPLQPSQFDIWTLRKIDNLVGEVKQINDALQVFICLNRVSSLPQVKEADEARDYITEEADNINLTSAQIIERAIFRKAVISGLSVHEAKSDKKAEAELDVLYKEIFNEA